MKKAIRSLLTVLIVLFVLITAAVFLLGVTPMARPFRDEKGAELKGSVAELLALDVNGQKQWISIRGKDRNNPVLLWLHGGPGSAQMSMSHHLDHALEEKYVVVHWDQRGAGKSNHGGFVEQTMTVEQLKDDALLIISYLQNSLGQEKIYLLGHSFGTQLGIELVQEYPEKFHGYFAVGQVVDHARAVAIAQGWLRQEMMKGDDQSGLEKLDSIENPALCHSDYRKFVKLAVPYGGHYDKSMLEMAFIAFQAPEYTFADYGRLLGGMNRGGAPLHKDGLMNQYNYMESVPEIEVPVYFFAGREDYNTPLELIEEYYNVIKAPEKRLIVFEHSAHTPFFSETEKFNNEIIRILDEPGGLGTELLLSHG